MSETQTSDPTGIRIFGAGWCPDCMRAKRVFGELGVGYEWIDLEAAPERADEAEAISGRKNIPVIDYPDGTHQVEPRDDEMRAKLAELGLA